MLSPIDLEHIWRKCAENFLDSVHATWQMEELSPADRDLLLGLLMKAFYPAMLGLSGTEDVRTFILSVLSVPSDQMHFRIREMAEALQEKM